MVTAPFSAVAGIVVIGEPEPAITGIGQAVLALDPGW